jgi:hypothetical protein
MVWIRRLRFTRHDATFHPLTVHDQVRKIMESHRNRRTKDQARTAWYAHSSPLSPPFVVDAAPVHPPSIYAFLAETSAPWVQDDVRYPVQP